MTGALSFHLIQFRLLDPCAAGVYSVAVRCGPIHDQGAYGAACVLAEIVPLAFDPVSYTHLDVYKRQAPLSSM